VVRRIPSVRGGWIECLRHADPHFPQRNFHPRQVQRDPEVVAAFGSATPSSDRVLLHYAGDPPPGAPRRSTPVILVHGAGKAGTFFWDPREDGSGRGLAQHLRQQGFQVFAVTFAHNQDDNYLQAEQLAHAIERVKTLTGARRVDLVAHSKGGVPARMYVSGFRQDWMTPYRGDVRRVVFVAAPLGGIDYSFRHPDANLALCSNSDDPRLNAPMSWDSVGVGPGQRDTRALGFSAEGPDFWPGQRQLLARLDHRYPLSPLEQDWYTTYYGGRGFVSTSRGIDHFIRESGHFMERLQATPIHPQVEVALLAGNRPDVPGILNEYTGPSDGVVFLESALAAPPGARVVEERILPLHHKALIGEPAAQQVISAILAADNPVPLDEATLRQRREEALRQGDRFLEQGCRAGATPSSRSPADNPLDRRGRALVPQHPAGGSEAGPQMRWVPRDPPVREGDFGLTSSASPGWNLAGGPAGGPSAG
jgi:hypothetical protein